jgi:hypothetical protein
MITMWYDQFDCDLYRVVPEARAIIAPIADIKLRTWGHPDPDGKLNSPAMWNGNDGLETFFGLHLSEFKPQEYICGENIIECTAEEAIRDLWVHSCIMYVDGERVWDSEQLWGGFSGYDVDRSEVVGF